MQNSNNNIISSKVLVIGLGRLGLPVAKYIKDRGLDVYGYDIDPIMMKNANKRIGLKTTTDFHFFDIYIICISTHKSDDIFSPYVDGIFSIAEKGIVDWFSVIVAIVIFLFIYRKKTDPILLLFLAGLSGLFWYGG